MNISIDSSNNYINSSKYFENYDCKYYPCHETEHINCLFCYCPLYHFDNCPGNPVIKEKDGKSIKVCSSCSFPHKKENYEIVIDILKKKV